MTVPVWRIAVEAPIYTANDLSGAGARLTGGRWNSVNVPMVYSAGSIALTMLEALAHLKIAALPFT